ncbi:hypothetical protein [Bacteroides acidifaciens]|jgi:hypothetical protein|uniref:hypothetical protein n=1 Tax=Bacteroides acidifaciens TaxID=85831 RepID=UPI00256FE366|nr:hypothetical protein [Bacteroides acidifaciens]
MKSKLLVLVAATATLEYRQKVLEEMTAKMGDVCEVVVGTPDELSVHAEAPVLVDVPVYEIQNRVMDNYVPRNLPSKKELRTSPYAKFDRFHHKQNKRKKK